MTMRQIDEVTRLFAAAADTLTEAHWVRSAPERLAATRAGTLQVAAAVLAARGRPGALGAAGERPGCPWEALARIAPELAERADHLARAYAQPPQDVRGLDDLLRAGEDFLLVAAATLGLPAPSLPATLVPVSLTSLRPAGGARAS
ncbi:hypothetical protein JNO54_08710 [Janibacter sp. YIM B02568]|nr:hypothetical protein [Janibacter endophyticus]